MKKSIFTIAIITFATGTILTSCSTPEEKVDAARENVVDANTNLNEAKDDYNAEFAKMKQETDPKITANEKMIRELKENSKNMKEDAKAEYEKTIQRLEEKNKMMKEKLNNYREEGQEKWESFKNEFNHDMDELGESLNDLTKNNVK